MKKCQICLYENPDEANYCMNCGSMLETPNYEEILGITITEDDLEQYILMGYIEKEMEILKNPSLKIKVRTLTDKDNTEIQVQAAKEARNLSKDSPEAYNQLFEELKTQWHIRKSIVEINGKPYDPEVVNLGTGLFNILAQKVIMLHEYLSMILRKGEVLKNF